MIAPKSIWGPCLLAIKKGLADSAAVPRADSAAVPRAPETHSNLPSAIGPCLGRAGRGG
jgi:hypothetical protein